MSDRGIGEGESSLSRAIRSLLLRSETRGKELAGRGGCNVNTKAWPLW